MLFEDSVEVKEVVKIGSVLGRGLPYRLGGVI